MGKQLYNIEYQESFLAHALSDTDFLKAVEPQIEPEHFSTDLAQRLLRLVKTFFGQHKTAPGPMVLDTIDRLNKAGHVSDRLAGQLAVYAKTLLATQLQHRRYLLERFDEFIRYRELATLTTKLVEVTKKEQLKKAEDMIADYIRGRRKTVIQAGDGGFFSLDPTERAIRRTKSDQDKLWLLIKEFDRFDVSLKRGHLGIWMSQFSSAGKSVALAHCATRAVIQGKKVLYLVVGEMTKDEIEDRLDSMIAGLPMSEVDDGDRLQKRLRNLFRIGGRGDQKRMWIEAFSAGSQTVESLRDFMRELENTESFRPDLVVLDYMDNVRPVKADAHDLYSAGKEIAIDLKRWAQEEHIYLWTAMQGNRGGQDEVTADMRHAGGSVGKPEQADLFITINRTKEEAEQGLTRCFVAKARHNGGGNLTTVFKTDFDRMQFYVAGADGLAVTQSVVTKRGKKPRAP